VPITDTFSTGSIQVPNGSIACGQDPWPVASWPVSSKSLWATPNLHGQWDVCFLHFDQDRGVLSGWFGTISVMHFDSLSQAYALNPNEKGSF
jgi:hypothetical protein